MKFIASFQQYLKRSALVAVALLTLSVPLVASGTAYALFGGTSSAKQACQGLDTTTGTTDGCDPNNDKSINKLLGVTVNLLSILGAVICVIIIIVAGVRLIVSGGDSNAISTARNTIIYAIVGLVIILMAQVLVRFVLGKANNPNSTRPTQATPSGCDLVPVAEPCGATAPTPINGCDITIPGEPSC